MLYKYPHWNINPTWRLHFLLEVFKTLFSRLLDRNLLFTRLLSVTSIFIRIHFVTFFVMPLGLILLIVLLRIVPQTFLIGLKPTSMLLYIFGNTKSNHNLLYGSHWSVQLLQPTRITFSGYTSVTAPIITATYLCPCVIIGNVSSKCLRLC